VEGRRLIITDYPEHAGGKRLNGCPATVIREGDDENWWIVDVKGTGRLHLARAEFRFLSPLEELAKAGE